MIVFMPSPSSSSRRQDNNGEVEVGPQDSDKVRPTWDLFACEETRIQDRGVLNIVSLEIATTWDTKYKRHFLDWEPVCQASKHHIHVWWFYWLVYVIILLYIVLSVAIP